MCVCACTPFCLQGPTMSAYLFQPSKDKPADVFFTYFFTSLFLHLVVCLIVSSFCLFQQIFSLFFISSLGNTTLSLLSFCFKFVLTLRVHLNVVFVCLIKHFSFWFVLSLSTDLLKLLNRDFVT